MNLFASFIVYYVVSYLMMNSTEYVGNVAMKKLTNLTASDQKTFVDICKRNAFHEIYPNVLWCRFWEILIQGVFYKM